jgi:uncharacterized OB-fold protein
MPWCTDNLGPLYAGTPTGINVVSPFDETMSLSFNANIIDREKILNKILGIETNNRNTKETNKMEAKKCDRCGKLYEMPSPCEKTGVDVRFKHMNISSAEDMSCTKIAEKQTKNIYIKCGTYSDDIVDLCPECRKSLKKWFESTDKEEKK